MILSRIMDIQPIFSTSNLELYPRLVDYSIHNFGQKNHFWRLFEGKLVSTLWEGHQFENWVAKLIMVWSNKEASL